MEVTHVEFLLLQPVWSTATVHIDTGSVSRILIFVTRMFRGSFNLQSAVTQPETNSRSKPFAYHHIQCRSDAVTEVTLPVMVTEVNLRTTTRADKPVAPEAVGLHFVLVRTVLHLLFRSGSLRQDGDNRTSA